MKSLFKKRSGSEHLIIASHTNDNNSASKDCPSPKGGPANLTTTPMKKEGGAFGLRGLLGGGSNSAGKNRSSSFAAPSTKNANVISSGSTTEGNGGSEKTEIDVSNSNDASNEDRKALPPATPSVEKASKDGDEDEEQSDEFDSEKISIPVFDITVPASAPTPAAPATSSASALVSEISNKARMRRLASGVVDQEFTIKSEAQPISRGGGDASPTANNRVPRAPIPPKGPSALSISLPGRAVDQNETTSTRGSTTTAAGARPQAKPEGSALTTTNFSRTFQRKASSSIACPGFDSEAAENELRKALQLRKLRTLQQDG